MSFVFTWSSRRFSFHHVQSLRHRKLLWGIIPVLTIGLLVIASHTFLSSSLLRQEIESRLSKAFRGRFAIERISPRGIRGLELCHVRFSADNGTTAHVHAIRLKFELSPLLRGKLYPSHVILTRPTANISLSRHEPASSDVPTSPAPDQKTSSRGRIRLWPGHVEIRDASLDVVDPHLHPLFKGAKISGTLAQSQRNQLTGTLTGQPSELLGTFRTRDWSADIVLGKGAVQLQKLRLPLEAGELSVRAELDTVERSYTLDGNLKDVEIPEKDLEGNPTSLFGMVSGNIRLNGDFIAKDHLDGTAHVDFQRIDFRPLQIVRTLGQIAGSNELAQLRPDPFKTQFAIENGAILIKDLVVSSPVSKITTTGTVKPGGILALSCSLALPPKLSASKWLDDLGESVSQPDTEGRRSLQFSILGTTSKPQIDILEKVAKAVLRSKTSGLLDLIRPKNRPDAKGEETPNPNR
jgi:hypothetical protein